MDKLEELGSKGIIVSFVYGYAQSIGNICWSVDVMNRYGDTFIKPYQAKSFEHAIDIAYQQCALRDWLQCDKELES